jgi:hypothetical protein
MATPLLALLLSVATLRSVKLPSWSTLKIETRDSVPALDDRRQAAANGPKAGTAILIT